MSFHNDFSGLVSGNKAFCLPASLSPSPQGEGAVRASREMGSPLVSRMADSSPSPSSARLSLLLAFIMLLLHWAPRARGQTTNGVFLPNSTPYGMSYAQWSAGWWQWNFSLPTTNSPIQDTAAISTGQTGQVWFLGGTFGLAGSQTRVRSGTVPEGTALFIGIMESWADNADCPLLDNYSTAQLRSTAASYQDQAFAMSCTIDDASTVDISQPSNAYRVQSPVFTYTMPAVHNFAYDLYNATCYQNSSGVPYTVIGAVADGVYLMVAPLAVGSHTIHFSGAYSSIFPFPTYVQDITYHLTVTPAVTPPRLISLAKLDNGAFQFAFSNSNNASFTVLVATNPALSVASWTALGSPTQVSPGLFQFTDLFASNQPVRFYRLRSP